MNIVVTFYIDVNERHLITDELKDKADVVFLKDINKEDRNEVLRNADILLGWNITRELIDAPKDLFQKLKFIQLLSAGYDHLKFDMFPEDCIISANQGAYAVPMAEHIAAMLLALSKRLLLNHNGMRQGEFDQSTPNRSLKNMAIGIIGFGGIGKETAGLLGKFGAKFLAINTTGQTEDDVEFTGTLKDLNYVLQNSDAVIISIPLNELTRGLIGKRELNLMKRDAILINVARGDIIVEKDLFEHLKSNPGFSAGIDAWWTEPFGKGEFKLSFPFLDLPNVIGSPHNSALTPGSLTDGQVRAVKNIIRFLQNEPVKGIVKRK